LVLSALRNTPTSFRDRLAHRLSLNTTPRVASAGETLGRFLRLTADLKMLQAAAALPDFCATVLGVERDPGLPVIALKKVARAALSPTPPLASFSRAGAASTLRSENTARGTSESGLSRG
jgi:hypothetical protein